MIFQHWWYVLVQHDDSKYGAAEVYLRAPDIKQAIDGAIDLVHGKGAHKRRSAGALISNCQDRGVIWPWQLRRMRRKPVVF